MSENNNVENLNIKKEDIAQTIEIDMNYRDAQKGIKAIEKLNTDIPFGEKNELNEEIE
ncbi:MAG: hypothetical protein IJO08_04845 [Clostridia bacterium]|nr:hypothetical protein [Clostridia bacterium]